MGRKNKGTYILNLEAKDLWLANHYDKPSSKGYDYRTRNGEINLFRFSAAFDQSLEWEKIKQVYNTVYRRPNASFVNKGKCYSTVVINVTFNFSVKEWNRSSVRLVGIKKQKKRKRKVNAAVYIKIGYDPKTLKFDDGVCIQNGKLVGIATDYPINTPVPDEVLAGNFVFHNGAYHEKRNPTVVGVRQLREQLYKDGFICGGKQYVRYKRSNGSARVGKCLFIDQKLYPAMHRWERCGIRPEKVKNFDLAAFEAYIGLTMSSIIGTIEIYPENILVIDDYESKFRQKMIVTEDRDGQLYSSVQDTEVCNTIWDGQSLMDSSLFDGYEKYGMLLLRNRFFKSCCFNTNIQQWFRDNNITDVSQLRGYTLAKNIEDIKLITTPSSIKYLKFGELRRWLDRISPVFGVVKHEKPSRQLDGKLVSTHYQLINTLEMTDEEVVNLLKPTLDFLKLLDTTPAVLRHYIHYSSENTQNMVVKSKNDIIYKFMGLTDKFAKTKLYEDFKHDMMNRIKSEARKGRILVNGTYATMCGNPIEMLQYSIGKFDGKSQLGAGNIYNTNFPFNKTILGSRSPHVCASNVYLANNVYSAVIEKYFNFSPQIVVVNSIGEPLLDRFSGSDFDSDTCLLTDNEILVNAARKNYDKFLVPVNRVKAKKISRQYTPEELADLDDKTSTNKIGEDINLAQILTTMFWHNIHSGQSFEQNTELYCDIVSLDILSNIEIDKAKREFDVNTKAEVDKLRRKYLQKNEDNKTTIPKFLGYVAKTKGYYDAENKSYEYFDSSMDKVERIMSRVRFKKQKEYIKFSDLIAAGITSVLHPNYGQRTAILKKIDQTSATILEILQQKNIDVVVKLDMMADLYDERAEFLAKRKINPNTQILLLKTIENKHFSKYRRALFYMLFYKDNEQFYQLIEKTRETIPEAMPDENGNIDVYGYKYSIT